MPSSFCRPKKAAEWLTTANTRAHTSAHTGAGIPISLSAPNGPSLHLELCTASHMRTAVRNGAPEATACK